MDILILINPREVKRVEERHRLEPFAAPPIRATARAATVRERRENRSRTVAAQVDVFAQYAAS
jgi:hypothetical protein